jgi:hypothetical protein
MAGRPPIWNTPEELWEAFEQYRAENKANPYRVQDYVGKDGVMVYRDKERPITFRGFEGYLAENGVCHNLSQYRNGDSDHHKEFLSIITRIRLTCDKDMLEGSSAGVYSANIASRLLGLVDKQENTVTIEQPLFGDGL